MRRGIPLVVCVVLSLVADASSGGGRGGDDSQCKSYRWISAPPKHISVLAALRDVTIDKSILRADLTLTNKEDEAAVVHSIVLVTAENEVFRLAEVRRWPVILAGEVLKREVTWRFDRPAAEVLGPIGSVVVELRLGPARDHVYFFYESRECRQPN